MRKFGGEFWFSLCLAIFLKLRFNLIKIPMHLPFQSNITLEKMSSLFLGKSLMPSKHQLNMKVKE